MYKKGNSGRHQSTWKGMKRDGGGEKDFASGVDMCCYEKVGTRGQNKRAMKPVILTPQG